MIKKLYVKNFMGIKEKEIELTRVTAICGENAMFKSSMLNALNWFLTDTLLTDKWGSGENDLAAICPKDQSKGQNVEVSVELDSGLLMTKRYVTEYSRDGKVKGHHAEGLINNVPSDNMSKWNQSVEEAFSFAKSFKTIDEHRAFTDPLYLLQKIDAKVLRTFLVELGAGVSNQELFEHGFWQLKAYEEKYQGDYFMMRKDLKANIKTLNSEIKKYETLLDSVADVEEFNSDKLDELEARKADLISQRTLIANTDIQTRIRDLNVQKNSVIRESDARYAALKKEREMNIENLKMQISIANSKIEMQKSQGTVALRNKRSEIEASIRASEGIIGSLTTNLNSLTNCLTVMQGQAKALAETKENNSMKLIEIEKKQYASFVTCPSCATVFAANPLEAEAFEKGKAKDIEECRKNIEAATIKRKELNVKFTELKNQRTSIQFQIEEENNKLLDLRKTKASIDSDIANASNKAVDYSEINKLNAQLNELSIKPIEVEKAYLIQLNAINDEIARVSNEEQQYIIERTNEINNALTPINEEIAAEHTLQSKWQDKKDYQRKLDIQVSQLNNTTHLLEQVNEFIQQYIEQVNDKATAITGIKFVMLEENTSNDGIKEVCYAVVDGVPFSRVNTAKKIEVGCQLITAIKNKGCNNTYPVLADRLEGIDHVERLKELTSEQLLCTRVTTDKEMVIINE